MKVLYLSSSFPFPAINAVTLRVQSFLKYWAQSGVNITFVCFPRDGSQYDSSLLPKGVSFFPIDPRENPRTFFEKAFGFFKTYHANSMGDCALSKLEKIIEDHGPFDCSVGEELAMGSALQKISDGDSKIKSLLGARIYVAHNVEYDLMKQAASNILDRVRCAWLFNQEKKINHALDHVFTYSEKVAQRFQKIYGNHEYHITSGGIDCATVKRVSKRYNLPFTSFIGSLAFYPNIDGLRWFAEEIQPEMKTQIKLAVAGSYPGEVIRSLAKDRGYVLYDTPRDLGPILDQTKVEIVPLRYGSGTRAKIIEAMAAGIPVISTSLGAEGLPIQDGKNILIADTARDFARKLDELIADESLQQTLSDGAWELSRQFDYAKIASEMKEQLETLCKTR